MFLLIGGPRAGQLVDDLPSGYRRAPRDADGEAVEVFDGFAARHAVWGRDDGVRSG
jgi:hypothetical protein